MIGDEHLALHFPNDRRSWHGLFSGTESRGLEALPGFEVFGFCLQCWIVFRLRQYGSVSAVVAELGVIKASYAGSSTPHIAWILDSGSDPDSVERIIHETITQLITETPIDNILEWIDQSGIDWKQQYELLMASLR